MDPVMEPIFTKMIPCPGVGSLKMILCSVASPRTEKYMSTLPRATATATSNDNAGNETVGQILSLGQCQSTVLYPLAQCGTCFIKVENEVEKILPFSNISSEVCNSAFS